ncbi:arylesterase [Rhodohalobacter mucosus]|uniref:Arylesterase n=1 Tax=Rhodohalobacter mucosus TaxID=2079485 RepID=A0A316TX41_9BACT|nr:arylesterase [Rhodohalobacter mucosus]PWN07154.1 arylesterase [Rhodohalobacter mucosus]
MDIKHFLYGGIPILLLVLFSLAPAGLAAQNGAQEENETILFFGDSITAGYGLEEGRAFPAIIQEKIDSLGLSYEVINSGLSGETSAGGLRRIDWVLQQGVDIFVLELGGNDGLRGIDPASTKQNLQGIIDRVEARYPDATIILTGMESPPNMGETYTSEFRSIYGELARSNDVIFLPFILEGVAGEPELNLPDGIHPTAEGHRILAENVWQVLRPVL